MNVLSQLLVEAAQQDLNFSFHPGCAEIKLSRLCFADDLLMFSMGKLEAVNCIKKVLHSCVDLSVLTPNPSKSSFYCLSIAGNEKLQIRDCLQWRRVAYLLGT
jgi:hypothetical protein